MAKTKSNIPSRSVLVIGGPDAGKTNYICRLWLAIKGGSGLLVPDGLPDNLDYLEGGVGEILEANFAPHTPSGVHQTCIIPIQHGTTQGLSNARLIVPDCSGESWIDIYHKRHWPDEWEQLIGEGCGCLIFVRADSDLTVNHLDWISCSELMGKPLEEVSPEREYEPPTQVVITDWLQCLRQAFTSRVRGPYRPRVGIVVAAWDLLPEEQQSSFPEAYLAQNFPLLSQYVRANSHLFRFANFGLSVMGGDPRNDPSFKERYLDSDPRNAGYVVHALWGEWEKSDDLTLPVAWALGIAGELGDQ